MVQSVSGSSNAAAAYGVNAAFNANSLTPDALMIYLQDRLSGLDTQVQSIFAKQQQTDKARQVCGRMNEIVATLPEDGNLSPEQAAAFRSLLDEYQQVDPANAQAARAAFTQGGLLNAGDLDYKKSQFKKTQAFLDNHMSTLEANAQLNMIKLQSLMSNRQTAIQLSTNLISSLGESQKAIASNIGR
jgi:hypothetical protein